MFKRTVQQYDQFRKRNAFLDQYKKEPMFENGLEEFDDARAVAQDLIEEYQACERPDYIVSPTALGLTSAEDEADALFAWCQDYGAPKVEGARERLRDGAE